MKEKAREPSSFSSLKPILSVAFFISRGIIIIMPRTNYHAMKITTARQNHPFITFSILCRNLHRAKKLIIRENSSRAKNSKLRNKRV